MRELERFVTSRSFIPLMTITRGGGSGREEGEVSEMKGEWHRRVAEDDGEVG